MQSSRARSPCSNSVVCFSRNCAELPKLRDVLVGQDEPELAAWCRFLSAQTDEELEALAMQHPILKEAKNALDELSADPDARERAGRREIELKLWQYGVAQAREEARQEGLARGKVEGLAQGKVEGLAQGKVDLLRRLLSVRFGELPPHVESRLTQATDAELLCWSERMLTADSLGAVFGP